MIRVRALPVGYLGTNCYLVIAEGNTVPGKKAFVVDPGAEAPRILEAIREEGVTVEKILITHAHFDHVGAAEELARALDCLVALAAAELREAGENPVYARMMRDSYVSLLMAAEERGEILAEGSELTLGESRWQVLAVPGHSPESLCYYCAAAGVLLSGDTLFSGALGREDFFESKGGAPGTLVRNVREKLMALPDETVVYPGHGPSTTVGAERARNPFLKD